MPPAFFLKKSLNSSPPISFKPFYNQHFRYSILNQRTCSTTLHSQELPIYACVIALNAIHPHCKKIAVSVTGSYPVYGANSGLIGYTNNYAYNGESILIVKDGSGVGSLSYVNDHFSVIGTLNHYLTAKENYSILLPVLCTYGVQLHSIYNRNGYPSHLLQRLWEGKIILSIH